MGESHRPERVGEEIRKIISELLLREIKDPRLDRMITVSYCDVSPDLSYAMCFITIMDAGNAGNEEEKTRIEDEVLAGFKSCSGLIKNRIGREMKLRRAPELDFRIDRSEEYGTHMDEMLRALKDN